MRISYPHHIGLGTDALAAKDLIRHPVIDEPFAIVRSGFSAQAVKCAPFIVIELSSATWRAIEPSLARHPPELLARKIVPVESFSAARQMIKAGIGDGFAPLGLVMARRIEKRAVTRLPGVKRRVSLLTRKTVNQLASFQRQREGVVWAARGYFRG